MFGLRTCLRFLGTALFCLVATGAWSACEEVAEADHNYVICTFDLRRDNLGLYWQGADGAPLGGAGPLAVLAESKGRRLVFAMNAGMYDTALAPVGLYIENGRMLHKANTRNGSGNFHMKPNGIFYFGDGRAGVMETGRYLKSRLTPSFATQSGPMLVIDGQIHPKFQETGTSEKVRNGVGVRGDSTVIFAISVEPVSFYTFATLFRDRLKTPNALFLDGTISTLYAPPMPALGGWRELGPILGVTAPP